MDLMFIFYISSGLFLGWSLGASDASNIFGTAVATKMVRFTTAAIISSIFITIFSFRYSNIDIIKNTVFKKQEKNFRFSNKNFFSHFYLNLLQIDILSKNALSFPFLT